METKKLKYSELLSLDAEVNGFYREAQKDEEGNQIYPEVRIVGIAESLAEDVNFILKYRLEKLVATINTEKKVFYEMQQELAKKYGTEKDGVISIETMVDGKPNKNLEKFNKENQELLDEEIELTFKPLPLKSMGDIVNSQRYSILYDFIED